MRRYDVVLESENQTVSLLIYSIATVKLCIQQTCLARDERRLPSETTWVQSRDKATGAVKN